MIEPILVDDEFLADVAAARSEPDAVHLWWLGQSGFLVQWQGHHLLLDPYLSDSLTTKYAATNKPHIRMTSRVVAPEKLDFLDVVTSSHNHTDHLDAETLLPILHANPNIQVVIPKANRQFVAERLHIEPSRPLGLDDGTSVTVGAFVLTGIASAHETLEQDEQGHHKYLGYIIQFGPWTLYHSGDTMRYDGMVERLQPYEVDVALLPINGCAPERRVAGNLDGREAATLAKEINAGLVIPCHYEMFEFNTASPDEFTATAQRLNQPYHVLRAGERWSGTAL
ncbi:MAG: MBL fold metallo-hydrolase [Abitibacteriaceae bacterium]|nr:MBL fold metallo-hydrolase [Abditibacteriaceae bacterium]